MASVLLVLALPTSPATAIEVPLPVPMVNIVSSMKNDPTCDSCILGLSTIDYMLAMNVPLNDIEEVVIDACQFGMPRAGFVVSFGRQFTYIIRHYYHNHTRDMCVALGMCTDPSTGEVPSKAHDQTMFQWLRHYNRDADSSGYDIQRALPVSSYHHDASHELTELVTATMMHDRDDDKLEVQPLPVYPYDNEYCTILPKGISTFLQLTDLHYDGWYTEGSNTKCGKPSCCRAVDGPGRTVNTTAGLYGDYHCDDPVTTIDALVATLQQLNPPPDFVIWTGDDPADDVWQQSQHQVISAISYLKDAVRRALPNAATLIIPSIGNHDSFPIGLMGGPKSAGYDDQWLFDALATIWADSLEPSAVDELRQFGYYSTLVRPGLRVISLNTQYGASGNFWSLLNETDPGGQLAWLQKTLSSVKSRGERCYIIGHIPFGTALAPTYSIQLHTIIDPYSAVVAAQLFGHSHHDSIEVARDVATDLTPTRISYVAPSVTPQTDINPSWRIYSYDTTNGDIVDYTQYSTDLEHANRHRSLVFTRRYTARAAYNLTGLTPAHWQQFVNRLSVQPSLFHRYIDHLVTGRPNNCTKEPDCIKGTICEAASVTPILYQKCMGEHPAIWQRYNPYTPPVPVVIPSMTSPSAIKSHALPSSSWQRAPRPFRDLC